MRIRFYTVLAILSAAALCGCRDKEGSESEKLVIFHAGSLSVPLRQVSNEFMKTNPNITVLAEAAGSRDCARKISDLGRQCDVMASADYTVVANLLMPEHADFNIRLATNEMAIAYTAKSKLAGKITPENWTEILLTDGVVYGRADPNRDPCGYRSVMAIQLAEKKFAQPGLADKLMNKPGQQIRPKETDLLSLLEAGEIDYLFIYRSVASQHKLKTLLLSDEVNLKSPDLADLYKTATIEITGKKPGQMITKKGQAMVYSVTIPKNSPNRKAAQAYIAFLLSDKGKAIMEVNGQPSPRPAITDGFENLPESIRPFCVKSE
ncbi:MAG: tungstate ABC transporter substrate-binding protein WtpA [Phycisphaerae bacterium]|jgi:molybdate/tungstate transport system substrate-binding protein|nr:tungstate ABC transporter substrate-binding protein WtpA [Phycisphaerae bacterium]MDP7286401.1 tungstate ABC transporter substrate-binding protein WtpA [Phycisphaerae bacterium]